VRYAKTTSILQESTSIQPLNAKCLDLGFYEKTLISQLHKFAKMNRGRDAPYLGDLLGGCSKCSTSLTMGETEDLPSSGQTFTKETNSETMLKFDMLI
jgi:hypothetical protein